MSNEISIFNEGAMSAMIKFSEVMATSTIAIPKDYRGNPGNCMAVIMQAQRWGMDPYIVASKTHVVSGNLGYEAQLVNAVITSSNAIKGRFHFEYSEKEWKDDKDPSAWIRVGATISGEDEIQWGERLYPSKVTVKNSPLWKTNPKQQAGYLAVKMWSRLYTPHVIMGVYTQDEVQEMKEPRDITPTKESSLNIPVNIETGEVLDAEPSTTVPDISTLTVPQIKLKMDSCGSESDLLLVGVALSDGGNMSLEEIADLKSHYGSRLKELRA